MTEQLGEKVEHRGRVFEDIPQGLKPGVDSIALAARLKSCPFKTVSSSAACNYRSFSAFFGTTEVVPFQRNFGFSLDVRAEARTLQSDPLSILYNKCAAWPSS
jgi:hypothetical protein